MRLRYALAYLAGAGCMAAGLACTSSSSSTIPAVTHGTETLTATVTGADAAANLNSNSNAPLTFPEGTWAGPVATTLKPFSLGGNTNQGDASWTTPAGRSTVFHKSAPGYTNQNAPPPATWKKTGTTCGFTATFSKGAFSFLPAKSTGEFARLTGTGTYVVTAQGSAALKSGDSGKACSFLTISKITDSGAEIHFTATAPVTLKPETATP